MTSRLYTLLMSYQGKELDDNFINVAFEIIMDDEKGLASFVDDFKIIEEEGKSLGRYNVDEKLIMVNRKNLTNPNVEVGISRKILTLQTLRHEIEHARDYQKLHEGREDIESAIIKMSLRDYAIAHHLDYLDPFDGNAFFIQSFNYKKRENYGIDPEERLVDIKAWKYIVNILKNQRNSRDLMIARNMLFYAFRRGYKKGYYLDPPTYQFLLNMGMYHQFYLFKKRVEEKHDYSFDTRINYGLPLDEIEYNKGILRKVKLWK